MNIKFKRVVLTMAAVCGLALVGCSSTSHEPAELESINELVSSDRVWSQSVGSSVTGLLTPFLTQSGLYTAGGNTLYKLDPKTGEEEWAVETDAEISAGVGSDGEFVAVGTVKGEVEVFDATGKKLWSARLSSEMSVPPLVGAGFVIVRTADTRITAFDATSGERRWRYQSQVPALTVRAASQMRFSPAGILVGQANGRLLALDGQGKTIFDIVVAQPKGITEVERLCDVVGTPLVDQNMMCAAAFQGGILCISAKDGRPLWRAAVDAVSGPVTDGGRVYVTTARGEINAYDYATGELVWQNSALLWRSPSAVTVLDDVIAVGDYDGVVHFLDPKTGKFVGRTSVSGAVRVPPISMGKGAIFQTDEGQISYITVSK